MKNKYEAVISTDLKKIIESKDLICELFLINGYRRNEIRQMLQNYDGYSDHVYIKRKKQKEKKFLLSAREKEIVKYLQKTTPIKSSTKDAGNKFINRHFSKLSKEFGFKVVPHNLRATAATELSRLGTDRYLIKEFMGHKKLETTEGYIQLTDDDVLEAKELRSKLLTIDGLTIYEWRKKYSESLKQIKRLEAEIGKIISNE